MPSILSAQGVTFRQRIHYPAIEIPNAQTTFVRGDSGTGKSTLFKMFNATASASEGVIYYQGRNLLEWDAVRLRREVLLVAQSVYLFEGSIRGNFEQFYQYRDEPAPSETAMQRFLQLCCADFSLNAKCETLSGGERQRVFLAIHLSLSPKVLMLDEPTSALDEATGHQLLARLKTHCAANQITLLVICHDRQMSLAFADHVVTLERDGVYE